MVYENQADYHFISMTLGALGLSPNSPFDLLTIVHLFIFGTRGSSWFGT